MRRSVMTVLGAIGLVLSSPALAGEAPIETTLIDHEDGTRSLHHETIVDAPVARVWEAFSTVEGWKSWGVKFAKLDFEPGGTIESGNVEGAQEGDPHNIVHRILAVIPERILVTRLDRVPEGGPVDPAMLQQLWAVYEVEAIDDGHTRLRISGHGYGAGEKFDRLITFFKAGNAASIDMMRSAIEAPE